jgi:hypothetical protein
MADSGQTRSAVRPVSPRLSNSGYQARAEKEAFRFLAYFIKIKKLKIIILIYKTIFYK